MIAARVAAILGKPQREGRGWRCRCPIHGGRSLVLRDGWEGRLLVRCWGGGCDPRDILAELHRFPNGVAVDRAAMVQIRSDDRDSVDIARRTALARRIWERAKDARGTPVARYLGARRITIPPPASLRWAPALRRQDGSHGPAMVAVVEHVERGVVGVHRTWIVRDDGGIWRRRDRASLGPIAGGAVRLAPAAPKLAVAEGIETALAVTLSTGIPTWAALSAGGIERLILPPIVTEIIICADHDTTGTGERAARRAAQRWVGEGRRVQLALPPEPGTDFNDVLVGGAGTEEASDVAA